MKSLQQWREGLEDGLEKGLELGLEIMPTPTTKKRLRSKKVCAACNRPLGAGEASFLFDTTSKIFPGKNVCLNCLGKHVGAQVERG